MEFKNFSFLNKKKENPIEMEKKAKIKEVLSYIKELAHDTIFDWDGRKKYHTNGTQPVNLLDRISRPLVGLSGNDQVDSSRKNLLDILERVLEKAKSINDPDVGKIESVIGLLNQPEIFSNIELTHDVAKEIGLFDLKPQVIITDHTKPPVDPRLN